QAGLSIGAIQETQAALYRQLEAVAEADRALVEVLTSAHAATLDGVRRLDAIAAEIDRAVDNQAAIGLDTTTGAREFGKFLLAKQHEILAVVSAARELDTAKVAVLQKLRQHYSAPPAAG
ncbi:MAG: DUF4226 domain-containing protein, partial [Mycobacterium sp.]|nr:DUF4226 domain-containing protein [Mycobacterium sp.]